MGERYDQYLICKERGHQFAYAVTMNDTWTEWNHCRFCGTGYRTQTTQLEQGEPMEDE